MDSPSTGTAGRDGGSGFTTEPGTKGTNDPADPQRRCWTSDVAWCKGLTEADRVQSTRCDFRGSDAEEMQRACPVVRLQGSQYASLNQLHSLEHEKSARRDRRRRLYRRASVCPDRLFARFARVEGESRHGAPPRRNAPASWRHVGVISMAQGRRDNE